MTRALLRFWIEAFVLIFSVLMIGVLSLGLLTLKTDFLGYYNKLPHDPSLNFRTIQMAFINSSTVPEAINSAIYCSLYPDMGCCALGGVMHCKI